MAPSGGNKQACHFLVIQSPDILAELSQRAVAAFAQMEATPDTYQSLASSIRKAKQGAYDFLYGAPVLVLAANLIDHGNAMADSACALENMMLAAAGFGLGSCWINQIRWLRDEPSIRSYLLSLGMAPEETIYGGVALGLLNKGRLCLWPVQAIVLPIYKKKPPKGGLFSSSYAGIVLCSVSECRNGVGRCFVAIIHSVLGNIFLDNAVAGDGVDIAIDDILIEEEIGIARQLIHTYIVFPAFGDIDGCRQYIAHVFDVGSQFEYAGDFSIWNHLAPILAFVFL
ncbi:MAG: nitroreductase family protein, partial [Christensenellales bacterium]